MKKHVLITLAAIILAASACSSGTGKMTMTTQASEVEITLHGTGTAIIDWGDGTKETYTFLDEEDEEDEEIFFRYDWEDFTHNYSGTSAHTITITGDNIKYLMCMDNQLTALDVSGNTALERLSCGDNKLTALNVSKNTMLELLYCWDNQLTTLNVSKNTKLEMLSCNDNKLTTLNVERNTALIELSCDDNKLTALNVSKNTMLVSLSCQDNQLQAAALNVLFESLHNNTIPYKIINILDNPGANACNTSIATNKGWRVVYDW